MARQQVAPPFKETVAKYVQETNTPQDQVLAEISRYAQRLGTPDNLDFAAWLWVREKGVQPPSLVLTTPFTADTKPWRTMGEAVKEVPENTGVTIRGYNFGYKIVKTKKDTDMAILSLADESGLRDTLVFGDQVGTLESLDFNIPDVLLIKGAQIFKSTDKPEPAISISGNYINWSKVPPAEVGLPSLQSLPMKPLKELKTWEPALIKALVSSFERQNYVGCIKCRTKFKDAVEPGRKAECKGNKKKNRDGCGLTEAKEYSIVTIVGFDNTGDIKIRLPPEINLSDKQLRALNLRTVYVAGDLQKGDDFRVKWFATEDQLAASAPTTAPAPGTTGTPAAPAPPTTTQVVTPAGEKVTVTTVTVSAPPVSTGTPAATPNVTVDVSQYVGKLMDYMNIFKVQSVSEVLGYLERTKVPKETAKLVLVEAVTTGKLVQDKDNVRLA